MTQEKNYCNYQYIKNIWSLISWKNANILVSRIDYDGGFTFYSLTVEVSDSVYSVDVPVAVEVRKPHIGIHDLNGIEAFTPEK